MLNVENYKASLTPVQNPRAYSPSLAGKICNENGFVVAEITATLDISDEGVHYFNLSIGNHLTGVTTGAIFHKADANSNGDPSYTGAIETSFGGPRLRVAAWDSNGGIILKAEPIKLNESYRDVRPGF